MYIARFEGRYQVKRMPGTGTQHKLGCDSFETPPGLSGFGDVDGSAIEIRSRPGHAQIWFRPGQGPGARDAGAFG
ncbi:hypothetical protein BCC0238_007391 (plasmid) [Burkholderia gladioli]